jgi:TonB family protein
MGRCAGGILLCAVAAAAQNTPRGPQDILDRVVEAYANVQGYQLEALVTNRLKVEPPGKQPAGVSAPGPAQTTIAVTYGAPDRLRLQDKSRIEVTAYHDHGVATYNGRGRVFISDPSPTPDRSHPPFSDDTFAPDWVAQGRPAPDGMEPMPAGTAPARKRPSLDDRTVRSNALAKIGFADYTAITKHLESARVLRKEDVQVEDEPVHCTVVEARYPHGQQRTFWVDSDRYAVLREVDLSRDTATAKGAEVEHTIEVRKLDWNVQIPNSVFELRDLPVRLPPGRVLGAVPIKMGCPRSSPESEEARIAGLTGMVKLNFTVDAKGQPTDIHVEQPLGLGVDEAAVQCLLLTEYQPMVKDGQPVDTKTSMSMGVGGGSPGWSLGRAQFEPEKGATRPYFLKADYPRVQVQGSAGFHVHLTIDKAGIPRDVQVVGGTNPKLDKQAVAIVQAWRFQPGQTDGKPIDVPADFELVLGNGMPPGLRRAPKK